MRLPGLVFLLLSGAAAQDQPIRVTTTLVQVDAIVTARDGRPITDLTVQDFEVLLDGKPREIRSFSYIRTDSESPAPTANRRVSTSIRREDVRRTIAILADDLKMSFESLHHTREALKQFVDKQVAPGDLVAILTTSGGTGPLQRFTTDKNQMRAAINGIRVNLAGGGPAGNVPALGSPDGDDSRIAVMLRRQFAIGTLAAIRHIVQGMREMPGRKSVVLFSEGMRMTRDFVKEEPPVDTHEVRQVSAAANRSSVVVYAIDPRGVAFPGLNAVDEVRSLEREEVVEQVQQRQEKLRGTQATLQFLASETGGFAAINNNDGARSLQRVLDDQSGYYLLGIHPDEAAAERLRREGKYHRLEVRVKRPQTRVRYRKGFLGDRSPASPEPRTNAERLAAALASPFSQSGVSLRFTPIVTADEQFQTTIRALLYVNARDVTFDDPDPQGIRTATIHWLAITEGESPSNTARTFTARIHQDALSRLGEAGFVYALEHEVKKPGPYQMRVAVLDDASGRTGSASRFVDVPDLARGAFALSGITMANGDWRLESATEDNPLSPALRRFPRGQVFSYGVTVYNAPSGVELQPRLIRGDAVVWQGKRIPLVIAPGANPRRLPAGGILSLGERTTPGEYILELQAVVPATGQVLATQSIDFELR